MEMQPSMEHNSLIFDRYGKEIALPRVVSGDNMGERLPENIR